MIYMTKEELVKFDVRYVEGEVEGDGGFYVLTDSHICTWDEEYNCYSREKESERKEGDSLVRVAMDVEVPYECWTQWMVDMHDRELWEERQQYR